MARCFCSCGSAEHSVFSPHHCGHTKSNIWLHSVQQCSRCLPSSQAQISTNNGLQEIQCNTMWWIMCSCLINSYSFSSFSSKLHTLGWRVEHPFYSEFGNCYSLMLFEILFLWNYNLIEEFELCNAKPPQNCSVSMLTVNHESLSASSNNRGKFRMFLFFKLTNLDSCCFYFLICHLWTGWWRLSRDEHWGYQNCSRNISS